MAPLSAPELEDLEIAASERLEGGALLQALTFANRTGELETLLRLLGMSDLLGEGGGVKIRPGKILVLGAAAISEGKLRSIAKRHGISSDSLEFALEYEELKHFNFYKLRYSYVYRAVLAGPMPHSTPGMGTSSSAIAEMESNPEVYPLVIRVCSANELKITNASFERALDELAAAC